MLTRKAQIWSFDFVMALTIFTIVIFVFFQYSLGFNLFDTDSNKLISDVTFLSNHLVSEGIPANWNCSDVNLIGLTDGNNRLNSSKFLYFYNLSLTDYYSTKRLFSITTDFQVSFFDSNDNELQIDGINKIGKNLSNENPKNLISSIRFLYYNSSIIKMLVQVW